MRKLYPVKMTKKNLEFLMTALDIIPDKQTRIRTRVRILSRLSAMGCFGYRWLIPKEKDQKHKGQKYAKKDTTVKI
jgi:hypothetical protein